VTLARRTKLLVGLSLLLAASLIGPAAAQASVLAATGHMPVALFGLDVGQLVGDIIKRLVDLVVPDFASHWAAALVKWLVAVPDVSNRTTYPHLNAVRSGLVGVGFALLGCSITASALQIMLGASRGAEAMKRAVVAGGVLVSYPKLFAIAVLAINITTGELITQPLVIHGIDDMLGAALVVAAITGGVSLGLALGAATACMYFVAALMVIKIGLTAIEAFLLLSGALVWGLYPLPGTSWLARMWTAGAVTVALIPITWALIFAAGALLSSDALLWSTSGKPGGLPTDLQQIVKPFAAVACFWVAYKAPVALLAACRIAGLSSSSMLPGAGAGAAGAAGAAGGRSRNPLAGAVQTNRDRFRAIGMDARTRTAPLAASARQRAGALRASAVHSVGQRLAPLAASASTAAGAPSSARGQTFDDAITAAGATARGAAKAAEAAKTIATAPVRANRAWRKLPEQGAAARQRATQQGQRPSPPAADHTTAAAVPAAPAAVPGAPQPSAAVSGDGRGTATPAAAAPRTPEPSAPARGDRSASRRPHRPATPAASVAAPAAQAAAAPSPFPIRPSAPSSTPAAAGTTDAQRRTSSSSPSPRPAGAARPAAHAPAPERPAARPFHNTPATSTPSTSPAPDDRTPADRRPAA
jgi:hypothetical protein